MTRVDGQNKKAVCTVGVLKTQKCLARRAVANARCERHHPQIFYPTDGVNVVITPKAEIFVLSILRIEGVATTKNLNFEVVVDGNFPILMQSKTKASVVMIGFLGIRILTAKAKEACGKLNDVGIKPHMNPKLTISVGFSC